MKLKTFFTKTVLPLALITTAAAQQTGPSIPVRRQSDGKTVDVPCNTLRQFDRPNGKKGLALTWRFGLLVDGQQAKNGQPTETNDAKSSAEATVAYAMHNYRVHNKQCSALTAQLTYPAYVVEEAEKAYPDQLKGKFSSASTLSKFITPDQINNAKNLAGSRMAGMFGQDWQKLLSQPTTTNCELVVHVQKCTEVMGLNR